MLITVIKQNTWLEIGETRLKVEVRMDGTLRVTIHAPKSVKIAHGDNIAEWIEEKEG